MENKDKEGGNKKIEEAEDKINKILCQLEMDVSSIIKGIDIIDVDITNLHDRRQRIQRRVKIDLSNDPNTSW